MAELALLQSIADRLAAIEDHLGIAGSSGRKADAGGKYIVYTNGIDRLERG
jgi:hypothetical protein